MASTRNRSHAERIEVGTPGKLASRHVGCLATSWTAGATWYSRLASGRRPEQLMAMRLAKRRPNLSAAAQRYLKQINASVEELFCHVLAVLHDPAYREANAGALRMDWPRVPLPGWPDSRRFAEAAETLARSAAQRTRKLAALLDPDTPVPWRDNRDLAPGHRHHCRSRHSGRTEHSRRRLRSDRWVGPLRHGRGGHAGPRPHC